MNRLPRLTQMVLLLVALLPVSAVIAAPATQTPEPEAGVVLCPIGLYTESPDDCLPLGPSETVSSLAGMGIPWPIRSLSAYAPDPTLGEVPYRYFKVDPAGTYIFPSIAAAASDVTSGQMIGPGRLLYVAYQQRAEEDLGIFYYLQDGGWIRGEGARAALPYPFQGLLFSSTPRNAFGWLLGEAQSRNTPSYSSAYTGRYYYTFNVVQVYAVQNAEGMDWLLIGPDEWLEARFVGWVEPRRASPEGITAPRWIEINLYEQTLAVYDANQLIFATLVSTGMDPFWTQPGTFSIYQKMPVETMSGSFEADRSDYYYLQAVPWTMYYDGKRALHGAYWHSRFGYVTSHGCVNMSLADSHWLYDWADEGDVVYVYDPSGQTPTDPSLYGMGAP